MFHEHLASVWRYLIPFALVLVSLFAGLLAGPRLPESEQARNCVVYVQLPGSAGFHMNCDSRWFLSAAARPAELLEPRHIRQSRPGLILLTAVPDLTLRLVQPIARSGRTLLAYWFVHFAILLTAFFLFLRHAQPAGLFSGSVLAVGLLLAFNDVVKAFLLSPHTQILNILAGATILSCASIAWRRGLLDQTWVGALLGFAVTASVVFVVALPAVLIPEFVRWLILRGRWNRFLLKATRFSLLVLLPTMCWVALVRAVSGEFYVAEADLHGLVVWIFAGHSGGVVVNHLLQTGLTFLSSALSQAWPAAGILSIALAGHWRGGTLRRIDPAEIVLCALVVLLLATFFAVVGYAPSRIAFCGTVPIIFLAGRVVALLDRNRGLDALLLAASVACGVYTVVKAGPYS